MRGTTTDTADGNVATGDQSGVSVASFTPGPWRVAPSHQYADSGSLNVDTADNGQTSYICCAGLRGDEEAEANARLIAAAPEMLAALHNMLEVYWGDGQEPAPDCIARAQAAIAKATTGTSDHQPGASEQTKGLVP
jgi:hypothetical protein